MLRAKTLSHLLFRSRHIAATTRKIPVRTLATTIESSLIKNELKHSESPYLRDHQHNPVHWQEWNKKSLDISEQLGKPIFLSIGYHTCHWCHVMNHDSYMDPKVAEVINKHFIPIKVDREQRPDVDAIYTMYMQATTGQSGWPLNVFLAPGTLSPFYGGMYWPSHPTAQSSTTFSQVLEGVVNIWAKEPQRCIESAETIKNRLTELHDAQSGASYDELRLSILDDVKEHFNKHFDAKYGGFAETPKFPCPHNLSFLMKYSDLLQSKTDTDMSLRDKSLFTLKKIGQSALKDHLGRGFSRYSVTMDWSLPHFEKLLLDQALLLTAYVQAYQVATNPKDKELFLEDIKGLIEYITIDMADPTNGSFYSAEDSDSAPSRAIMQSEPESSGEYNKIEGGYYLWQSDDFARPLTRIENDIAAHYWNVQELGNIDSEFDVYNNLSLQNTLHVTAEPREIGMTFGKNENKVKEILASAKAKLQEYRTQTRERPAVDKKVITGWNGAAIGALAQASHLLAPTDPALSEQALTAAKKCAHFIYTNLFEAANEPAAAAGKLFRMYSYSKPNTEAGSTPAVNEDYAYLISGLLDLYQTTFDPRYLDWAKTLQEHQISQFWDSKNGGFYTVPNNNKRDELFLCPKNSFDSAEPSSNGVSADNLFRLAGFLSSNVFRQCALDVLHCFGKELTAQPFGYCSMLGAVVAKVKGIQSVLIVGNDAENTQTEKLVSHLTRNQDKLPTNLTITRITAPAVDNYFEHYGNTLYGALEDKYGKGPVRFFTVDENFKLTNEGYETAEEAIKAIEAAQ